MGRSTSYHIIQYPLNCGFFSLKFSLVGQLCVTGTLVAAWVLVGLGFHEMFAVCQFVSDGQLPLSWAIF